MNSQPQGATKVAGQDTDSSKEEEHKPKLLGPVIFWWGGGLPREGAGAEKFGMSLEAGETKLFWRGIPGFCQDIPGLKTLELVENILLSVFAFRTIVSPQDAFSTPLVHP